MLDPIRVAGFVSAHAAHHGREPEFTFRGRPDPDSYTRRDSKTVDYIFLDPAFLRVRNCRVVLDQPHPANPALYPSDHAGVMADLAWR
jgi:endonuclease/exonuclease/phosphatase family metal-dependent hydrolase